MLLTFLAYMSFHATRKVPSNCKDGASSFVERREAHVRQEGKARMASVLGRCGSLQVTKHGYKVSGAGTPLVNGDYDCKVKSSVDDFVLIREKRKTTPFRFELEILP